MALKQHQIKPRWPAEAIDLDLARVSYDVPADEFLVFFGGKSVPKVSSRLHAPGFDGVNIMFAFGADRKRTDEIVGVHVIPMMVGAVQDHPHWAVLVWATMGGDHGTELLRERLPLFLDEVAEAFRKYWKPAPPVGEQLAALQRRRDEREAKERAHRTA